MKIRKLETELLELIENANVSFAYRLLIIYGVNQWPSSKSMFAKINSRFALYVLSLPMC